MFFNVTYIYKFVYILFMKLKKLLVGFEGIIKYLQITGRYNTSDMDDVVVNKEQNRSNNFCLFVLL